MEKGETIDPRPTRGSRSRGSIPRGSIFTNATDIVRRFTASEGSRKRDLELSRDKTEHRVRKYLNADEWQVLAESIKQNTTIRFLELTGARIGENGAKELAECLKINKTLTHIELRRNWLGDVGVQYLTRGLAHNLTVLRIDIEQDSNVNKSIFRHIELLFDTLNLVRISQEKSSVFTPIRAATRKKLEALLEENRHYRRFLEGEILNVDLRGREMKQIPFEIYQRGPTITMLSLPRNHLEILSERELRKMVNLTELVLPHNKLTIIPDAIGFLPNLKVLDVNHNRLTAIPTTICFLTSLTSLDISKNTLTELPKNVGLLNNLSYINASKNPFKTIPKEILQSPDQLLPYLRNLLVGSKMMARMKLMLVGNGNVGKTTLSKALRKAPNKKKLSSKFSTSFRKVGTSLTLQEDKNVATDGIDIEEWEVEIENSNLGIDTIQLSTWDFGGQEVYYATHIFFLSQRSIYLLCFNLVDPPSSWKLDYWLRSIQTRAKDAPVILIGTHADEKICDDVFLRNIYATLQADFMGYTNIKGVYYISSTAGTGIEELRSFIVQVATTTPNLISEIPINYLALQERVYALRGQRKPPILSWDEFTQLSEGAGISAKDSIVAAKYLHDLGDIVHINDPKSRGLNKMVVLEPQWLTQVFSTVISAKKGWVEDGIILQKNLSQIWKPPNYPPELHDDLLSILDKFEIAFKLPQKFNLEFGSKKISGGFADEAKILIASLLPLEEPNRVKEIWPDEAAGVSEMERIYSFKFLPMGFMSRLIIRSLHFANSEVMWRYGLVLKRDQERAMIKCDSKNHRIRFHVRGKNPLKLLQLLTDNLDNLALTWLTETSEVQDILIPCPQCQREKFNFTLKDCEMVIIKGQDTVKCNSCSNLISLDLIAPDVVLTDINYIDYSTITIDTPIGTGGFATVYKATLSHGELVAVKQLEFEKDKDHLNTNQILEKLREFRREVMIMSALRHANIVEFIGMCLSPACIITEFLSYGDLGDFLKSSQPLSGMLRDKIIWDIANGINYMHSLDPPAVHRDLKTPNILMKSLNPEDPIVAKVSDFGTTLRMNAVVGRAVDNPTWLAPEIMRMNSEYSTKSDVYSFGLIMWEIHTREIAFAEYNIRFMSQLEDQIMHGLRPTMKSDIPNNISQLIQRCWDDNPDERPTMKEVVNDLHLMLGLPYPNGIKPRTLTISQRNLTPISTKLELDDISFDIPPGTDQ